MRKLVILAVIGLLAQLVDGSLGMAYGTTTSTLLLLMGTNPAAASATVHLSEIGTTLAAGASHWRFGNVHWPLILKMTLPGVVGALIGATFLANLDTSIATALMAGVLSVIGLYLLARFTFKGLRTDRLGQPLHKRFLVPLGLFGGFVDSTGGGGWGPIGTSAILASGRLEPRKVIGSMDTSEFLISVAASVGFLFALGAQGIKFSWVAVLLVGGIIAAPIAAWLVRILPARILGSLVGGMLVLTNARTIMGDGVLGVGAPIAWTVHAVVAFAWIGAVAHSYRAHRVEVARTADAAPASPEPELAEDRA